MSYNQVGDERSRSLEEQRLSHDEQLPAYSEATKNGAPVEVTEKDLSKLRAKQSKSSNGRMSTLKSILTGDVHKHNPRYVLEESLTGESSRTRPTQQQRPKAESSSVGSSSTLKSILTGAKRPSMVGGRG